MRDPIVTSSVMSKPNMQKPIEKIVAEERALAILRLMSGDLGGVTNDRVLARCLEFYGLPTTQSELRTQLDSLECAGVIKLEKIEGLLIARICRQGVEVAKGMSSADGIAECGPECPY